MDRLTNGFDYCQLQCDFGKKKECFFQDKSKCYENNMYNKLRQYEIAEEQGLLLRLPCKVGDEVYLINHSICENRKIPLKCVVDEFTFDHGNRCYAVLNGAMSFYALRRFKSVNIKQFGLTVFLTKEEAEAIMDERNGR